MLVTIKNRQVVVKNSLDLFTTTEKTDTQKRYTIVHCEICSKSFGVILSEAQYVTRQMEFDDHGSALGWTQDPELIEVETRSKVSITGSKVLVISHDDLVRLCNAEIDSEVEVAIQSDILQSFFNEANELLLTAKCELEKAIGNVHTKILIGTTPQSLAMDKYQVASIRGKILATHNVRPTDLATREIDDFYNQMLPENISAQIDSFNALCSSVTH